VNAIDEIAPQLGEPIFGQVGKSEIRPKNFGTTQFLKPDEFQEKFRSARVVVAHAGIGTILTAKQFCRPVVLMPRRATLGEHRNDHQLATVSQLGTIKGVYIAQNSSELLALLKSSELTAPDSGFSKNRADLVNFLRGEIRDVARNRNRSLPDGIEPENPCSAEEARRMLLLVTANNETGSLTKLDAMLASIANFADQQNRTKVEVHLLLQNSTMEGYDSLQMRLPSFVCLHAIDHRISLSRARNILLCAPQVQGKISEDDIVGFPDDDCWFPHGTLEHIERTFSSQPDLDFWFCRYGMDADSPSGKPEANPSLQDVIAKASSNTMYFRGRTVTAIGGFDEALGVGAAINGGEDTDYALRAFNIARKTAFLNERVIGHRDFDPKLKARYYPGSLVAILRHARKNRGGLAAVFRKIVVGCVLVCQRKLSLQDVAPAFRKFTGESAS
jgi:UDP-N-acetylglucosamine transferase subunit ALG13